MAGYAVDSLVDGLTDALVTNSPFVTLAGEPMSAQMQEEMGKAMERLASPIHEHIVSWWNEAGGGTFPDEMVKSHIDDPNSGFLDAKIDDITLKVNLTTHKVYVDAVPLASDVKLGGVQVGAQPFLYLQGSNLMLNAETSPLLVGGDNMIPTSRAVKMYVDNVVVAAGSGGDMYKSTYDTGNNGIVDDAEKLNTQPGSYYLTWANFTGTPTILSGYGITDAYTKVAINAFFEGESLGKKQVDWARITNKPNLYTVQNNADNRVITGSAGYDLYGEPNLIFDGTTLTVTGNINAGFVQGSVVFEGVNGLTEDNDKLYFEDGNLAVGANSGMRNVFQAVKAESITDIANVKALVVSRNTNTTNNNWTGLAMQTEDSGGNIYSGARIMTQFISHSTNAVSANMVFDTRNAGVRSIKMVLTAAGILQINTLNEYSSGVGVTIDGVLLKDNKIGWSYISGTPTTFGGYGISDTLANLNTALSDATLYKWEADQGAVNIHGDNVVYGSAASTACIGNDARLSNARTPLSHIHGNITNAGAIGATANLPIITTTAGVLTVSSFGTASNTFCVGNDSRLSNARTPTAHASSHLSSGADTIANFTSTVTGLVPLSGGGTTNYLRADGSWAAPPGSGGGMVYPGAGIALSTGSAWNTSITNNSGNWNTAYGWGDHAGLYSLVSHAHKLLYSQGNYQISNSTLPSTLGYGRMRLDFIENFPTGSQYRSILSLSGYNTGHTWTQLAFNYNSGNTESIYFRNNNYNNDVWGSWYKIWHSGNFDPTNYLLDTTDTFTGTLTVSGNIDLPYVSNWRFIKNSAVSGGLKICTGNAVGTLITMIQMTATTGYVKLNDGAGTTRLQTSSAGVTVTGDLTVSGLAGNDRLTTVDVNGKLISEANLTFDGGRLRAYQYNHGVNSQTLYSILEPPNVTSNTSNIDSSIEIFLQTAYNIATGITDSGYRRGLWIQVQANNTGFIGTLGNQVGLGIRYGDGSSATGGGHINTVYGINLDFINNGSSTFGNIYSIYSSGIAKMYHAGAVQIVGDLTTSVITVSNEIRVPDAFHTTDPSIGVFDNTHYGINISKTSGIGLLVNGTHRVIATSTGATVTGSLLVAGTHNITLSDGNVIKFHRASANYVWATTAAGYLLLGANGVSLAAANALVRIGATTVQLRYGSTAPTATKLETTSGGVSVTGVMTASSYVRANTYFASTDTDVVLGTTGSGTVHLRPTQWDSSTAQSTFTASLATIGTNTSITGTLTVSSHIYQGDSDWHYFGASNDVGLFYHPTNGFYIQLYEHGKPIYIRGEDVGGTDRTMILADPDGGVWLYDNGAIRLSTAVSGVDVTGRLYAAANVASGYAGMFFNDGNNLNRYGIKIQCGVDSPSAGSYNYPVRFYDGNGGHVASIRYDYLGISFNFLSDIQLKENIEDYNINGLDIINQMQYRSFNWKKDGNKSRVHGWVADEAEKIFPEMVSIDPETGYKMVAKETLIPVIMAGIKELDVKVESHKDKIIRLETRVGELENEIELLKAS